MARTPLFRELRRVMAFARVAGRDDWSADRARETYALALPRRTRRAFLREATLSAAALAATSCAPRIVVPDSAASVVVIGGGIAGLTCAYRLYSAGVRVRLFEAQERVGGRIYSVRDKFADGQVAELGGELIDSAHTHLRSLASELGLALDDFDADAPELVRTVWFFGGQRRSAGEVVDAFIPIARAIARDQAVIGDQVIDPSSPAAIVALDRMSLAAWFDREGVSGWIRSLLEVAYETEMGLAVEQQSALGLLTLIDANAQPFRVFGESDERYHVRGGNDAITSALGKRLAGVIETGAVLESVRARAGGDFELSVRFGSASRTVSATHLVLATPLAPLRRVELRVELPARLREAIGSLRYGTNAKLMIGFAKRSWRERQHSDGSTFTDLACQTTWEASRAQLGAAGILTCFVGGREGVELGRGTTAERAADYVALLEQVFSGIADERVGMTEARFHWPSNPWVMGSYMCLGPGDWTRFGGVFEGAVGRLRFAGEHCSRDAQGFMEGGCETGERVASELIAELVGVAASPAGQGGAQ
jgi:monoamine oxidase